MNYRLQTFAVWKDRAGNSIELEGPEGLKVTELMELLEAKYPLHKALVKVSRLAVNDVLVNSDYTLNYHDQLCLFPPSSGG